MSEQKPINSEQKSINIEEIRHIFEGRKAGPLGRYRYYSVLVPLTEKDGELHVIFEVRAEDLKRQPGEVCFPGGRMENNETSLQCAVRETAEELNIPESGIEVIAPLDYIYTYSNFTLYSYLGRIPYEYIRKAQVNEQEVKEIFLVPLSFFLTTEPYYHGFDIIPDVKEDFPYKLIGLENGYRWRKGKSEVYIYQYEGHAIWGLTGRIIKHVAEIVKGRQ